LSNKELIHSRFIAFLLNPKGGHNCKQFFLDEFIKMLNDKNTRINNGFQWENARAEKKIKSGRVDIFVKNLNSNQHIIIENKIYAVDQNEQLERYRSDYGNAVIVYLTLDGRSASSKSKGKTVKEEDYIRLSYENDIIGWIRSCKKSLPDLEDKTKNKILLLLTEYLELTEELTRESTVQKEILLPTLAKNADTLATAFEIYDEYISDKGNYENNTPEYIVYSSIRKLKAAIIETRFCSDDEKSFLNKLCEKNGWEWELNEVKWVTLKDWGFYIYKKRGNPSNSKVGFKFNKEIFGSFVYSLCKDDKWLKEEKFEYFDWHRTVFYDHLMKDEIENTDLFLEFERVIKSIL